MIRRTTGLFTEAEINKRGYLRGIPKTVNSDVHLSRIRMAWHALYETIFGAVFKKRKKAPGKKAKVSKAPKER